MLKITFILFPFFFASNLSGQQLLWPTDASQLLTATFSEYRPGHFHAGIDIKTWGREGYRVFAVDTGSVVRIQLSPYGYGRAVYLRTQTGQTVVYGHLSRFNDEIESIVRSKQVELGKYRVRLYFNPGVLPYNRGDLLGYTGSTGIGLPHLHFEIRDSLNRPINPLQFGFPVADSIAPEILAIAISPLCAGSHVNGDFKPQIFHVTETESSLYAIDEPPVVHGMLGVSLAVQDMAGGATNKLGLYQVELWIDGEPVYRFRNDRFSYDESGLVELIHNTGLRSRSDLDFVNLFQERGNTLSAFDPAWTERGVMHTEDPGGAGSIQLAEGTHTLWIVASDYFGNQSEVFGDFTVRSLSSQPILNSVHWMADRDPELRHSHRLCCRFLRDYLYFSVEDPLQDLNHPSLVVQTGFNHKQIVPMQEIRTGQYAGYFPLNLIRKDVLQISLTDSPLRNQILDRLTVPVSRIAPFESATVISDDQRFAVQFNAQSVYETLWCSIQSSDPMTCHVLPDDVPLKKAVRLSFHLPDASHKNQMALYQVDDDGGFDFAGNHWDSDCLTTRVNRLGKFAVLRDSVPPEILSVRPGDGAVLRTRRPKIRIAFLDSLSGIGDEDGYVILLDVERLIMEYDPEEDTAFHQLDDPIQPGEHRLDITFTDRCGNTVQRSSKFTIRN